MKELLGQGRTAEQMRAHEDMADALAFWVIRCACAVFLVSLFLGCAAPRVYVENGVTFHQDDLSPCERGATGCYVNGQVYYSSLDTQAKGHEIDHSKGMRHAAWTTVGYEVCAKITAQGNTAWHVGALMCRRSDGSFVQREM